MQVFLIRSFSSSSVATLTEHFQAKTLDKDQSLSDLVKVPKGMSENTYVCSYFKHSVGSFKKQSIFLKSASYFMTRSSLIFFLTFSISDNCTIDTCPEMTAGPHYTYLWTDDRKQDPISVSVVFDP